MAKEAALKDVEKQARTYTRARAQLWAAIRVAHDHGHSLRAIAVVAGLSHEQVRRIVSRDGATAR